MGKGGATPKKEIKMKKTALLLFAALLAILCLVSCNKQTELSPNSPVTLTMWHVYGEQADSPMNRLVEEFNRTEGAAKGIIINVTSMSNASQIGPQLLDAQANVPGAMDMPDLFFCHSSNTAALGVENLLDWKDYFTGDEMKAYVPEFVEDGMVEDTLAVFPVSKSTHLLFVAGGQFERFSKDTGVTYDTLATWDGFFTAAEKYHAWSGGKPFCAIDYLLRCVELNAMSKGAADFMSDDGWYDFSNEKLMASWEEFACAIAKGHVIVSDMYSNTQVMTGEVVCGIGSSASILYYNDTITYEDNTKEPMQLSVCPLPQPVDGEKLVTQAGVGLCAYKTTSQKAEAAVVFAKWLTESDRNLAFVAETGYMPVHNGAFESIGTYKFKNEAYASLYAALTKTKENCTAVSEPFIGGYYNKVNALYAGLRTMQKELPPDTATFVNESIELFKSVG